MATINNYIDIVTLAQIKTYLRIDDTGTRLNDELTVMIDAACLLIEQSTNHILKPKTKTIQSINRCIYVYDTPITDIVEPSDTDDFKESKRGLYSIFTLNNPTNDEDYYTLEYDCGYDDTDDVPETIKQAIKEAVRVWFYAAESRNIGALPESAMQMIHPLKRFFI